MRSKVAAVAVAAAVVAGPVADAATATRRARVAARYIVANQNGDGSWTGLSGVGTTADAVVALAAARRAPKAIGRGLRYLRRQVRAGEVDDVGRRAKTVLAAVAGGADPRRFGGRNLVRKIRRSEQPDGRYGASTPVFSHALALLALAGAGARTPAAASAWLAEAQCDDGGWQFDEPASAADDEHCIGPEPANDFFTSDTNTTGLAVQALAAAPAPEPPAADPFGYFAAVRDPVKRGWGYNHVFTTTDAYSTALVLQAFAATGAEAPAGARRALRKLQYRLCGRRAGAFAVTWADVDGDGTLTRTGPDLGATVAAVPGILGVPLPLPHAPVTRTAPKPGPCP